MYGGDQPDIMASLMYGNMANMANLANMGYQQPRYAPTMMGMMPDMGIGMQVGAQPNYMMSKKPSKDKNAPKRNWTSYQFYVEENRASLKEKSPEALFGQLSKIAAAQWKALSPEVKRRYEVMAENDKMRYQEEMRHYVGPAGFSELGKKKIKKNKNAPKGPLSAYFIFTSHIRPSVVLERPDLNLPGVTKEIAQRWRNLSAEERVPFEEKSKADKTRYQVEMAAYKQGMM